jgi:uncharacterized protein YdhG (YjbR/CyaY superfamily)
MQADPAAPATIDEYIASFSPDVQEVLRQIRATVRAAVPDAEETIKYGMPTYVHNGNLVYFAAFKKHVGFFGTSLEMGDGALKDELSVYAGPKGSLKFPLGKPVPLDLITRIVEIRVKENQERSEARGKKA